MARYITARYIAAGYNIIAGYITEEAYYPSMVQKGILQQSTCMLRQGISWPGALEQGTLRLSILCQGILQQGVLRQGILGPGISQKTYITAE